MTRDKRSALMSRIRAKDTAPEWTVRRTVHKLGFRYRLHVSSLPGKPDLVFPRMHKVIFVNGCFWHRHNCAQGKSVPKTNAEYWESKFAENHKRDIRARTRLRRLGWRVLVIWQCNCRNDEKLRKILEKFLKHN